MLLRRISHRARQCARRVNNSIRKNWLLHISLLIFDVVFAIVLIYLTRPHVYTLHAGETRKVTLPGGKMRVTAKAKVPVDFFVLDRECPPLQTVPWQDRHEIEINRNEIQYESFYLLKGSTLQVNLTELEGTANFYILQGELSDPGLLRDKKLREALIHEHHLQKNNVFQFRFKEDSSYTLLYKTLQSQDSRIRVEYHMNQTNFNLAGQEPICTRIQDEACTFRWNYEYQGENVKTPSCAILRAEKGSATLHEEAVTVTLAQVRSVISWVSEALFYMLLLVMFAFTFIVFVYEVFRKNERVRVRAYSPVARSPPPRPPTAQPLASVELSTTYGSFPETS